jgi:tRNA(fMet)-specific endonuclease VapC
MRYMLDTNICIYLIKRHPPEVLQRFDSLQLGDVVMSSITYAELRYGVERNPAERDASDAALSDLIRDIPVLPFGEEASVKYGLIRAAVRDRRRDALDRLIAAHAVSRGLVLVTNNEADFEGYPGLTIENWVAG